MRVATHLALLATLLAALGPVDDKTKPAEPKLLVKPWLESGPSDRCVDVLFVGDGYSKTDVSPQAGKYWKDVVRYASRLFQDEPFRSYKAKFNVRAAFLESKD